MSSIKKFNCIEAVTFSSSEEDAEELQSKVDSIRKYYEELQGKAQRRRAKLEEALEPSEDFVRAHRRLEKSLPALEEALRAQRISAESEKDVERLENDLGELEPSAEQLKKSGAKLKRVRTE